MRFAGLMKAMTGFFDLALSSEECCADKLLMGFN